MTDSNWKPVPHDVDCQSKYVASGFQEGPTLPCSCDGTRWHGYGERVGDLAGVLAFAQGMAWLGGEAAPLFYAVYSGGELIAHVPATTHQRFNTDYKYVALYTHPPAAVPSEDARDAARYRFIRDNDEVPNIWSYMGDSLDAAIDAAMSATASQEKGS